MSLRKVCLTTAILLIYLIFVQESGGISGYIIRGLLLAGAIVFLDMYWHQPANTHSFYSLLMQYISIWITRVLGNITMLSFKISSRNAKLQQERCLMEILKRNSQTKFAKDHAFDEIRHVDDFFYTCPLTTYADYIPYFEDIIEHGACDILFPGKADFIAVATDMTGDVKVFPKNIKMMIDSQKIPMLLYQGNLQWISGFTKLQKVNMIGIGSEQIRTSLGVPKGSLFTILNKTDISFHCSPSEVYGITTERECLYLHALFGVMDPYVGIVSGVCSTILLTFFKLLEKEWKNICDDIESGKISNSLIISIDLKSKLEKYLGGGNKRRAIQLRSEFNQGFKGIIPRIWPECALIAALENGSFAFTTFTLQNKYSGGIPIISVFHNGSGTFYGVRQDMNILDKTMEYVMLETSNFWEFVPVWNIEESKPKTLLAHEVKVNSEYELVVTTPDGLCRYRTRDIVRITEFYNEYPKYTFLYNQNDVLNLTGENLPEVLLSQVLAEISQKWPQTTLEEFVSVENFYVENRTENPSERLFYMVFIEVSGKWFHMGMQEMLIDKHLRDCYQLYAAFREKGKVEYLQLLQVLPGTFDMVKEELLDDNINKYAGQFKMPKIIRNKKILKLLLERSIQQGN